MGAARCPSCSATIEASHAFCPGCGLSLGTDGPTGTAPRPARVAAPSTPRARSTTVHSLAAVRAASERFAPGTVLLGRYRIVGLLGRGGMGEVYRADDLKLEQVVALKFLPQALEGDPERLERLWGEVRMARQVSHPHVCRVWDIGEADGQHFLSMEFVDGENLASLLRRIGRLPGDKALEIAGQVAAGLAAAHDKGVLHRDLKPANVMLDGNGQVRLTDFGLAGIAASLSTDDVRSGTPSYMAPEQLQGREVTARSDVYALGLLLYELFTGRRAFEGRSAAELARQRGSERPLDPSLIVPDLDPAVERTILACLEREPRQRPPSANAVLAMLGGRDPLEAALAAGDTPSPELVAAAGESARIRPVLAWSCAAVVLAAVALVPLLRQWTSVLSLVPAEKSPAALEDRARDLLQRLGATAPAADSETGLVADVEYMHWVESHDRSPQRWQVLRGGDPPVIQFWYRQSPRPLAAPETLGKVTWAAPDVRISGMAGVRYDLRGRLTAFYSVPPQVEDPAAPPAAAPDWAPLLAEARLSPSALRPVAPERTPPFYCDTRAAWEGRFQEQPELPLRVEVAAYRGRPVWFEIVSPWSRPERMQPWEPTLRQQVARAVAIGTIVLLTCVGAVLARRNIRLGRVDRRGAARLGLTVAALVMLSWALHGHHVADPGAQLGLVARGAGVSVLAAALLWLFYLALEPYVRRMRPWTLVSWTRALNGTRDAVVGRDVLIGMAWGGGLALLLLLADMVPGWLGKAANAPDIGNLDALLGSRSALAYLVAAPVDATLLGLGALLLFLVLRFVTRRDSIAVALIVAMLTVNQVGQMGDAALWFSIPISLLMFGSYTALLLRHGVLAAIAGPLTATLLLHPPHSWALGSWQSTATEVTVPFLVLLAGFAFATATARRKPGQRQRLPDTSSSHVS